MKPSKVHLTRPDFVEFGGVTIWRAGEDFLMEAADGRLLREEDRTVTTAADGMMTISSRWEDVDLG